jgi:hypothetical protein
MGLQPPSPIAVILAASILAPCFQRQSHRGHRTHPIYTRLTLRRLMVFLPPVLVVSLVSELRMTTKIASGILAFCLLAVSSSDAQAGIFHRRCRPCCPPPCYGPGQRSAPAPIPGTVAEGLQAQINALGGRVDRLERRPAAPPQPATPPQPGVTPAL